MKWNEEMILVLCVCCALINDCATLNEMMCFFYSSSASFCTTNLKDGKKIGSERCEKRKEKVHKQCKKRKQR